MSTATAAPATKTASENLQALRKAPAVLDLDEGTLVRSVALGRGYLGEFVYAELRVQHNVSRGRIVATIERRLRRPTSIHLSQPVVDREHASTRLADAPLGIGSLTEHLNAALGTAIRVLLSPEAAPYVETILAPAHEADAWQAGVVTEAR